MLVMLAQQVLWNVAVSGGVQRLLVISSWLEGSAGKLLAWFYKYDHWMESGEQSR